MIAMVGRCMGNFMGRASCALNVDGVQGNVIRDNTHFILVYPGSFLPFSK
jgi:hypothetical protein